MGLQEYNISMNNVAFRKRIKWVVSGAIHPIVIFNEALLREVAADEIDPSYATKPFPWVFDEGKIGDVYNFVLGEFRKNYKTEEHYKRHEREIFWRLFGFPRSYSRQSLNKRRERLFG